jgi:hypothetical protein
VKARLSTALTIARKAQGTVASQHGWRQSRIGASFQMMSSEQSTGPEQRAQTNACAMKQAQKLNDGAQNQRENGRL